LLKALTQDALETREGSLRVAAILARGAKSGEGAPDGVVDGTHEWLKRRRAPERGKRQEKQD